MKMSTIKWINGYLRCSLYMKKNFNLRNNVIYCIAIISIICYIFVYVKSYVLRINKYERNFTKYRHGTNNQNCA